MSNEINIVKRNGERTSLNIDKIHKVVMHACEGLAGVSSSQIEMNANLQFYDGMTTAEIQEVLVRSANDLISLDAPNYQYAAARLLGYGVNKQVFGKYENIPFIDISKKTFEKMLSAPAFKLNGSGWYETDFKKSVTKTETKSTATEASVKTDNQKNV